MIFLGQVPQSYSNTFKRINDSHSVNTRQAITGMLKTPKYNSVNFGFKCIYNKCIESWNKFTSDINHEQNKNIVNKLTTIDIDLQGLSRNKLKQTITSHILSKYED